MPSSYLSPGEYTTYGLASATAGQVVQASTQVDAFLKRRQGCIWVPDTLGNPCYMLSATPTVTLIAAAPFGPGSQVVVPYSGAGPLTNDFVGEVLVIDRSNSALVEACQVASVDLTAQTLTLLRVINSHNTAATMDAGLQILEEIRLAANRAIGRIGQWPVVNLISGYGRYGYGRRLQQTQGVYADVNLLATVTAFGGPPPWMFIDTTGCGVSVNSGEIWIPAGIMLAYYSEVRFRYVAGWSAANLPYDIKQATANIVMAIQDLPVSAAVKGLRSSAGGISVDRFGATLLSEDTKALLTPYAARVYA